MAGIVYRINVLDVKKCITGFLIFVLAYFALGDIYMYLIVQDSTGILPLSFANSSSLSGRFSLYRKIGVKNLFLDLPDFYIYLPVSNMLYELLPFRTALSFITPNSVTYFHLLIALIATNCINNDSLNIRRIGVGLFAFRNFLDEFDGTLARNEKTFHEGVESIGTFGYYLDGLADGIGCIFLYVSCLIYLHRHPVRSRSFYAYSPLPLVVMNRGNTDGEHAHAHACWKNSDLMITSGKTIQGWSPLPVIFGIQSLICSYSWNRYIVWYMKLLEDSSVSTTARAFQGRVVKSTMMWVVIMFWRLFNPHSMVELLLIAIFFDRMGEFLSFMQYIGFIPLVSAICLTEIHLNDLKSALSSQ